MAKTKPIQVKYLSLPLVGSEKRQKLTPWWKNSPQKVGSENYQKLRVEWNFYFSLTCSHWERSKVVPASEFSSSIFFADFFVRNGKIIFSPSRGRARKADFYAFLSKIFNFWLRFGANLPSPNICGSEMEPFWSHLIFCWGSQRQFGAKWHQNWCHLEPPHLFPVGEAIYQGVFEKNLQKFCCCAGIRLLPFTFSMVESHFVPPSKRFLHLTHGWRSFCQPIRREILLQSLTATFAAEKRHDFWKNIPTILYRNFQSRKTTHFPKLFQKSFLLLYRKFFRSNLNPYFKNFSLLLLQGHLQS